MLGYPHMYCFEKTNPFPYFFHSPHTLHHVMWRIQLLFNKFVNNSMCTFYTREKWGRACMRVWSSIYEWSYNSKVKIQLTDKQTALLFCALVMILMMIMCVRFWWRWWWCGALDKYWFSTTHRVLLCSIYIYNSDIRNANFSSVLFLLKHRGCLWVVVWNNGRRCCVVVAESVVMLHTRR